MDDELLTLPMLVTAFPGLTLESCQDSTLSPID